MTATTTATTPAVVMAPLAPYLSVPRAAEAIDWYRDVLGAVETSRFVGDDGRVGHAELAIGTSRLLLADEYPEMGFSGPDSYGGSPVSLHLEVVDVDYTFQRAVEAGADGQTPPSDQVHGNRNATIIDPFGHRWMISQALDAARTQDAVAANSKSDGSTAWTETGRAPVEPGYLSIHTPDPARAREFFGALFAWNVSEPNPDGGGHVENTKFPLAISASPEADGAPTDVYFRVDDVEYYAQRVEELGGRVLSRSDYSSGGNASCVDDQGYRFELWKPAPGY